MKKTAVITLMLGMMSLSPSGVMGQNEVKLPGALTISGNTFANRSIGEGKFKGRPEDNMASGIVLESASVLNISGNTFSNLSTKALTTEGKTAR